MFCRQCGKQIDDDSRFCRHCGVPQTAITTGTSSASSSHQDSSTPSEPDGSPASPNHSSLLAWGIGGTFLILLLVAIAALSPNPAPIPDPALANVVIDTMAEMDSLPTTNSAPIADSPADPWTYSSDEDKVRGKTTYYATTTSTNTIHQDSPYDSETTMSITVRKSPAFGTDVILRISSGQMMCPSYEGCSGTVRFDDHPAQTISFNGPTDNSSETIFVAGARSFISELKKSRKVVIEKTLYQAGNPQFEFDITGLKWEH